MKISTEIKLYGTSALVGAGLLFLGSSMGYFAPKFDKDLSEKVNSKQGIITKINNIGRDVSITKSRHFKCKWENTIKYKSKHESPPKEFKECQPYKVRNQFGENEFNKLYESSEMEEIRSKFKTYYTWEKTGPLIGFLGGMLTLLSSSLFVMGSYNYRKEEEEKLKKEREYTPYTNPFTSENSSCTENDLVESIVTKESFLQMQMGHLPQMISLKKELSPSLEETLDNTIDKPHLELVKINNFLKE